MKYTIRYINEDESVGEPQDVDQDVAFDAVYTAQAVFDNPGLDQAPGSPYIQFVVSQNKESKD